MTATVRRAALVAFVCLIAGLASLTARAGASETWTGMISDSQCGGDHGGEVDVRECTLKCTSQNCKYVLMVDGGTKAMQIANQSFADLPTHAGHTVVVTGELQGTAIQISKIAMQ
jgi:hypothetical protein